MSVAGGWPKFVLNSPTGEADVGTVLAWHPVTGDTIQVASVAEIKIDGNRASLSINVHGADFDADVVGTWTHDGRERKVRLRFWNGRFRSLQDADTGEDLLFRSARWFMDDGGRFVIEGEPWVAMERFPLE